MNTDEEKLNLLTEQIIGCAFKVSDGLGCGFVEKVYENALAHELRKAGLSIQQLHPIIVLYDDIVVGEYFADLIVENTVILELNPCQALDEIHSAQCLNYLLATGLPVCLLINFGTPKIQIKRFRGQSKL